MNELGIAVVWCVLQVTLLSGVAVAACIGFRRGSPALRSWIALLALSAIPALTLLAVCPLPSWFDAAVAVDSAADERTTTENGAGNAAAESNSAERGGATVRPPSAGGTDGTGGTGGTGSTGSTGSTDGTDEAPAVGAAVPTNFLSAFWDELSRGAATRGVSRSSWPGWLAWAVVACGSLGLLHLLAAWLATRVYRRRGTEVDDEKLRQQLNAACQQLGCRREIQLREMPELTSAATFGFFRPVILLPSTWREWTDDERRAVLAHEAAHIVHRDYFTGLVAQLCLAVHFYHPLVHWLASRLQLDQELSADAAAARVAGGQRNYLTVLAEMALRQDDRAVPLPARMFLPTRRSFLRRIEMLRSWKALPVALSTRARGLAAAALVLLVLVVSGFRSPTAQGQILPEEKPLPAKAAPYDTRYVSEDGGLVLAVRPARALTHPALKEIRQLFENPGMQQIRRQFGFPVAEIDQVILTSSTSLGNPYDTNIVLRTTKPADFSTYIAGLTGTPRGELETDKYGSATIYKFPASHRETPGAAGAPKGVWQADDRTIVFDTIRHLKQFIDGEPPSQRLLKTDAWQEMSGRDLALLIDQSSLRLVFKGASKDPVSAAMLNPILDKTRRVGGSLVFGETQLEARLTALSRTAEDAAMVSENVKAAHVLAKNLLAQMNDQADAPAGTPADRFNRDPLTRAVIKLASQLLAEMKIQQQENVTHVVTTAGVADLRIGFLAPAITAARAAARRTQSINNLKVIGIAFHNHHAVHKSFPAAAGVPEGKQHPVSWRVALLPYLGDEAKKLHDQYNFDEPWDSDSNRQLIAKMPDVYRHPAAPADATSPSYFVLVGPDTIFRGDAPRLRDILDGTSNTVLAVEAKRDIPWTKPEDIAFDKAKPIPPLGGYTDEGYNAVLADGAVRFLIAKIDRTLLQRMIMSQDHQPLAP